VYPVVFEIISLSGRDIAMLSPYPEEKEVVFRPFTSFRITSKNITKINRSVDGFREEISNVFWINLREVHSDIRGRKILVIIDDNPQAIKEIMDTSERKGITCVWLSSTAEVKEFFNREEKLLEREVNKLRVITHFVDERLLDTGIEVIKVLKEFKYIKPILYYSPTKYLRLNRNRFKAEALQHVFVTDDFTYAVAWAEFVEIPHGLSKIIS